jgi:DNA-binding transcriptional MerR regulator
MSDRQSIKEVARLTQLSAYTLRYYEQLGLIGPIVRTATGHRRYQSRDLEAIEFVKRLRATGMPLADMKRMGELRAQGQKTQPARMRILFDHRNAVRARVRELEANLMAIESKLTAHGWVISTKEHDTKERDTIEHDTKAQTT